MSLHIETALLSIKQSKTAQFGGVRYCVYLSFAIVVVLVKKSSSCNDNNDNNKNNNYNKSDLK